MQARHSSFSVLVIAALVALASIGCAHRARVQPLVVGPIVGAPSPDAFERLLQTARSQGYFPEGADVSLGSFRVATKWEFRGVPQQLHVQCFASGHVQVVPVGPRISRREDGFLMPAPVRDELVLLARALAAGAGVSQQQQHQSSFAPTTSRSGR